MEYKILIADDEPDIRELMSAALSRKGFQVITAEDGQDAWEKILSDDPDVILLDLNMPRMDGWEVLRKLRKEHRSDKWQPVIIISAEGELDRMKQGMELEADHYLVKPCDMEDILRAIRLMVSLIPARRQ